MPTTYTTTSRQFCCVCLASTIPAVTVDYPGGRRFHFCTDHADQGRREAAR
jgi:hypothetical protein